MQKGRNPVHHFSVPPGHLDQSSISLGITLIQLTNDFFDLLSSESITNDLSLHFDSEESEEMKQNHLIYDEQVIIYQLKGRIYEVFFRISFALIS